MTKNLDDKDIPEETPTMPSRMERISQDGGVYMLASRTKYRDGSIGMKIWIV